MVVAVGIRGIAVVVASVEGIVAAVARIASIGRIGAVAAEGIPFATVGGSPFVAAAEDSPSAVVDNPFATVEGSPFVVIGDNRIGVAAFDRIEVAGHNRTVTVASLAAERRSRLVVEPWWSDAWQLDH